MNLDDEVVFAEKTFLKFAQRVKVDFTELVDQAVEILSHCGAKVCW